MIDSSIESSSSENVLQERSKNVLKSQRSGKKMLQNSVEMNKFGKLCHSRIMKKPCGVSCKFKCCSRISESDRESLFLSYWQWFHKTTAVHIQIFHDVSEKRGKITSLFLLIRHILSESAKCSFLHTLGILQQMVITAHKK